MSQYFHHKKKIVKRYEQADVQENQPNHCYELLNVNEIDVLESGPSSGDVYTSDDDNKENPPVIKCEMLSKRVCENGHAYKEPDKKSTCSSRNETENCVLLLDVSNSSDSDDDCRYKEIRGDLFSAPEDFSLVHCVRTDLALSRKIAIQYRQQYDKLDVLQNAYVDVGKIAVLKQNNRFIYFVVNRTVDSNNYQQQTYTGLATYLELIREHVMKHGIKKLAMTRLCCRRKDQLKWTIARRMIQNAFSHIGLQEIVVYLK